MRGRGMYRRLVVTALACTALSGAMAAPAPAQIANTIVVPITIGPAPGTGSTFQLTVASLLFPHFNRQAVVGQIGPDPFVGVLVFHSYEKMGDIGHYRIFGTTATGTPLDGFVDLTVDRFRKLVIIGLKGNIGGTPFELSRSFVIPV